MCRWINAIYGCTHRHAQLNDRTHRALNEMFGVGNIKAIKHLALMMRKGLAVTEQGGKGYFADPGNMAEVKLLLLQGRHNYIFRPAARSGPCGGSARRTRTASTSASCFPATPTLTPSSAPGPPPRCIRRSCASWTKRSDTARPQPRRRSRSLIAASPSSSAVRIADSLSTAARSMSAGCRAADSTCA